MTEISIPRDKFTGYKLWINRHIIYLCLVNEEPL